ncbi:histidine phosphatase family protein [Frigidibacter sp. MR17.14]|uniref:histidine phosphatase family protein n=1 Tax=Frigidibacter sp. MR17.14 TaxID=3126509 RepID=UPI003012E3B2
MVKPMIYLLRHGQTEFNLAHRFQGHSDSPLTDLGARQGIALGRLLAQLLAARPGPNPDPEPHPDPVLLTSPLGRARATAERLARALPPPAGSSAGSPAGSPVAFTPEPRLAEVSLGRWDGLTRAEIAAGWPDARRGRPKKQWMFHAPGGESLPAVTARLTAVLDEARARQADTVMVSHAVTGRLLRGLHAGQPLDEALLLDAPQNVIFALGPGGAITRHALEGI